MRIYKQLITLILVLTIVLSQGVLTPLAAEQSVYSEEIEVIKALGIMVGDETGDFGEHNKLTRAEFANVLTVLLQINDSATTKENAWYFKTGNAVENQVVSGENTQKFTDVPADYWAYNVIDQVTSLGYMVGTSENEFSPEENVTLNQVNKVFVKMLGYEVFAERNGGYPTGYNYTASSIKLLKGINHYGDTPILRGELAKIIVNMFGAAMVSVDHITDNGVATYEQAKTSFLTDKLGIFLDKGEVTAVGKTGVYGNSDAEEGEVVIGGVVYKLSSGTEYIKNYLGKIVEFYYVKDTNFRNVLLYAALSDDTDEFVINIKDFVNLSNGVLKYYDEKEKVEKLDLVSIPAIIFNGTSVDTISTEQLKEYHNGTITAINSDNRGAYDMLVVEAYRTMYVKNNVHDVIVNGIPRCDENDKTIVENATLNLKKEDNKDKIITIYDKNVPATTINITRHSVIDVAESGNEIKIIITKEQKNSTITGIADDVDGYYIYDAEGNSYKIAGDYIRANNDGTASLPVIGSNCVLYFNSFGEVAYAEVNTAEYANKGLIIDATKEGKGLSIPAVVKIFSDTGRFNEYTLAEKVTYTNSDDVEVKKTDAEMVQILKDLKNKLVTFRMDDNKVITGIKEPINYVDRKTRDQGRLGIIYQSTNEPRYIASSLDMQSYAVADTVFFSISLVDELPEEEKYQVYTKKELDSTASQLSLSTAIAYNTNKDSYVANVVVTTNKGLTTLKMRNNQNPLFVVDKVKKGINADGETTVSVEGTYLTNGRMPEGKIKTFTSKTGAFDNLISMLGSADVKYGSIQKGDIINCMEVGGDVKAAFLIFRRNGWTYPINPRNEDGGIVGVNNGIYDNSSNSNPCAITEASNQTVKFNGYDIARYGFNSSFGATTWNFYDLYAVQADEQYMTFTTQDLSVPGSAPEYNNTAYKFITIPVQRYMTHQTKKGDNYTSGSIMFTGIKTYEANLNECSRVFMITYNGSPYKMVVLNEE